MKVNVTPGGVTIPGWMLQGAREVYIRQEEGRIFVELVRQEEDPVFGLDTDPVDCGVPDGSTRHDAYLYGADR